MSPEKEKRHLNRVLKMRDITKMPIIFSWPFRIFGAISIIIVLLITKRAYEAGIIEIYIMMFVLVMTGAIMGFYTIYRMSYALIPVIVPFFDFDKVESRVNELNT